MMRIEFLWICTSISIICLCMRLIKDGKHVYMRTVHIRIPDTFTLTHNLQGVW